MLLDFPTHKGLQRCVKELNHFYLQEPALWADDFSFHGFEWVDFHDARNSVISYLRKAQDSLLLCIHNFTPQFHEEYILPVKGVGHVEELFNSDEERYGGSGKVHQPVEILSYGLKTKLAPLATVILRIK